MLEGRDVTQLDPSERDIAMVFQNYALYPHMTVFDNMAYGLRIRGLSRTDIRTRVDEAAGLLGLGELLGRKPRQLSGGQRQRVAMGRAIVRHPKLFLFDEPLSNLDAKLRLAMRAEIRRLQRRLGVTSLFVTHDQVEAMTLGDRLLVLHQGRPAQLASPMEVFARPADTYVAGFIGAPTMNFLPASWRAGVRRRCWRRGCCCRLPTDGGRGRMATRSRSGSGRSIWFPGSGWTWRSIWSSRSVRKRWCMAGWTGDHPLVVKLAGPSAGGERLSVAPQVEHMHVFDRASGRRIDPVGEENMASRLAAADTAD